MSDVLSIKKNGCSLTINTERGKVYPVATGKVPKSLQKAIDEIRGFTMLPEQAMNLLKHQF